MLRRHGIYLVTHTFVKGLATVVRCHAGELGLDGNRGIVLALGVVMHWYGLVAAPAFVRRRLVGLIRRVGQCSRASTGRDAALGVGRETVGHLKRRRASPAHGRGAGHLLMCLSPDLEPLSQPKVQQGGQADCSKADAHAESRNRCRREGLGVVRNHGFVTGGVGVVI